MIVSKPHKKLILNLRDPERITTILPKARTLVHKGKTLVAVPHGLEEVRVLRNLGFDAPAPMGYYYDWPGRYQPFAHQKTTSEFLTLNERAFCLNGMGSGKTVSVLWAFDYLKKLGLVKRMLVISPLSTLERAWGDEIFRHFPELNFAVLHGDRKKRHQLLANDFDVYVINHDGIKNDATVKLLNAREGLDLIVVDEIASFRNSATERWKALNALINGSKKLGTARKTWAWGLTGTPTPNVPTDAWAQVKLINPGKAPGYFGQFRDTVMRQAGPFGWAMRETALETVRDTMQPAVRFSREECIDLPPTTFMTRQTTLTPEQDKAFKEMLKKLKAETEMGAVTAINEAVKLSKLLQICCGVAYGVDGDVVLPNGPRIELVRELIHEAEAKVLVFVPFTGALKSVADALRTDFSVSVVDGSTSKNQRDTIFKDFQNSKDPRVLVANPGTLSHGLTLTAANTIIWACPIHSNETYQQANARVTRPGQKLNTLIVNIEATELERKIYARLQGKEKTQGLLLNLIKGEK
jgi:SNF2 family DNA or RNA helicase